MPKELQVLKYSERKPVEIALTYIYGIETLAQKVAHKLELIGSKSKRIQL